MEPQVHEWMFVDSFADLEGHQWEIMFKDEKTIPNNYHQSCNL